MVTFFSHFFLNFRALCSQVTFQRCISKAPIGFLKWTFINVQNQKPKVEFTFTLLPEKSSKKKDDKYEMIYGHNTNIIIYSIFFLIKGIL